MKWHYLFATLAALVTYGLTAVYLVFTGSPLGQLLVVAQLAVLEVVLSFDNATINARYVRMLSLHWQKLFLSLGILIAVIGMRLLVPDLVVSACGAMNPVEAMRLAFADPQAYATDFQRARLALIVFGGVYLLQIFTNYMVRDEKQTRWLRQPEEWLEQFGEWCGPGRVVLGVPCVAIAVLSLVWFSHIGVVLLAGGISVTAYQAVSALSGFAEKVSGKKQGQTGLTGWLAFAVFMQLELQDATFSVDSVMGGFAFTMYIVLIMAGSGIGALYVRTMTIHLASSSGPPYLESAAYWAIGFLPFAMWFSAPGGITGGVTTGLIVVALLHGWYAGRSGRATADTASETI